MSTLPFKQPLALIVAGGEWQYPLVSFVKRRGYSVWVADPYEDSKCVSIADRHLKVDARDAAAIESLLADDRPEIILSDQSDVAVDSVALLNERFQLAGNTPSAVQVFRNKYQMREFADQQAIPQPRYQTVSSAKQLQAFVTEIGGPCIIKPADAQSSRGLQLISTPTQEACANAFAHALAATSLTYALVERFVEGIEITIEGICLDGQHRTMATSSKRHMSLGIASDLAYPSDLPHALLQKICAANDRFVNRSALTHALTHAEYLVNPVTGDFWLVEIAARGGGSLVASDVVSWVSGQETYALLLDALNGQPTPVDKLEVQKRAALLHFFSFKPGTVRAIHGLETARRLPGVFELRLSFNVGDTIAPADDDRSRAGFVILFQADSTAVAALLELVYKTLTIEYV